MPEKEVSVIEGVEVSLDGDLVTIKGPKGELKRSFSHHNIKIKQKDGKIIVSSETERAKIRAIMGTWKAHIMNMVHGVKNGHECSLKMVYSHFPIKLETNDGKLVIKNFLGERSPRTAKILDGVEIKIEGDTLTVTGADKENVGQTAANIEQATKVKGHDRRVFQDGIYITQKPVKAVEGEMTKNPEKTGDGEGDGSG
jgi:large subunit ribosomal protein L6